MGMFRGNSDGFVGLMSREELVGRRDSTKERIESQCNTEHPSRHRVSRFGHTQS